MNGDMTINKYINTICVMLVVSGIALVVVALSSCPVLFGLAANDVNAVCLNFGTSFISISLTTFVIDRLMERDKIEKKKWRERKVIISANKSIENIINNYIIQQSELIDGSKYGDDRAVIKTEFCFSGLRNIFDQGMLLTDPFYSSRLENFCIAEAELHSHFLFMLFNINFEFNTAIRDCIIGFIKSSSNKGIRDALIKYKDMRKRGDPSGEQILVNLFKKCIDDPDVDWDFQYRTNTMGSTIMFVPYLFYVSVKEEAKYLNDYLIALEKLKRRTCGQ